MFYYMVSDCWKNCLDCPQNLLDFFLLPKSDFKWVNFGQTKFLRNLHIFLDILELRVKTKTNVQKKILF